MSCSTFTASFDAVLADAGITVAKIPLRTELTDRMLTFGERHLRKVLAEYAAHYNEHRPHRALHLRPPRAVSLPTDRACTRIKRRPILGGLINEYSAAA